MFDGQFYPTPSALIEIMMGPLTRTYEGHRYSPGRKHILEPSAGTGEIADWLTEHLHVDSRYISCIELDPERRLILQGKGYKVIDRDFLTYTDPQWFDLVIMNPPFKWGAAHALKAWEVLGAGDIVCVLNAQTIKNPHTKNRKKLAHLIKQHGRVEFHETAFVTAERSTDVEVAVVWLKKEAADSPIDFDASQFEQDGPLRDEDYNPNAIASRNTIARLVAQYEGARQAILDEHKAKARVRYYVKGVERYGSSDAPAEKLNEAITKLKQAFWQHVFDKTKIGQVTTSEYQRNFQQFAANQANMAFTVANIGEVLELFMANQGQIMQKCVVEVFDRATKYHRDNRVDEGWRTNSSYKVNKRIIMPYGVSCDNDGHWSSGYGSNQDFFVDVDKAMCFLTGKSIENVRTVAYAIRERIEVLNSARYGRATGDVPYHSSPMVTTFFNIKIFKKGTVHLEFRDLALWEKFNATVAEGKNWIGQA